MKMKLLLIRTVAVVAVTGFLSLGARADVISHDVDFTLNNTHSYDYTYGSDFDDIDDLYAYLTLPRFDPLQGTLTGVEVSFTSEFDHNTYAYAYDSYGENGHRHCSRWGWSRCSSYYDNDTWVDSTGYNYVSIVMTDPNLGGGSTHDRNLDADCSRSYDHVRSRYISCSGQELDPDNPFNGTIFSGLDSAFLGGDPLDFTLRNYARISGNCDNNDHGDRCRASTDSYWSGNLRVHYTFDAHAVPEPSTLALLGLGLIGAGFSRRRSSRA